MPNMLSNCLKLMLPFSSLPTELLKDRRVLARNKHSLSLRHDTQAMTLDFWVF